jgi:hypothetical protein
MSNVPEFTPGSDPATAVKNPAMFLMIVAGISAVLRVVIIIMLIFGVGLSMLQGAGGGAVNGAANIVGAIVGVACDLFIIFGAMKMQKLQSYGLAMAAAIVAIVPCFSPCCIVGIPFGIWALIVLLKPEVKVAFTQGGI